MHETEAGAAYDHITLNFERQDGSSLQSVVQKEVLYCILDSISNIKKWFFSSFLYASESGTAREKVDSKRRPVSTADVTHIKIALNLVKARNLVQMKL